MLIGDDYETPVTYWMPFIGELGIGFHDASWRSSFGGDIYKNSGSHGCVNLPVSAAEQLFNIVYDGMPVILLSLKCNWRRTQEVEGSALEMR